MAYSSADLMCVCISREVLDGDILPLGVGTSLVATAFLLAHRTHAPNLYFLYPGNCLSHVPLTVSLVTFGERAAAVRLRSVSVDEMVCELLPNSQGRQFFRPVQIDAYGNFNTLVIGDYATPKVRLAGAAIFPEASGGLYPYYLYAPRHSAQCFVERVDFVCGSGTAKKIFTDLGVFAPGPDGRLRPLSLHPGIDAATVQKRTGFAMDLSGPIPVTPAPTPAELELIAAIDPMGVREVEFMEGAVRTERVLEICRLETAR